MFAGLQMWVLGHTVHCAAQNLNLLMHNRESADMLRHVSSLSTYLSFRSYKARDNMCPHGWRKLWKHKANRSNWEVVMWCNTSSWLYFLYIPLLSPSALTSRWRASKSTLVQSALAPQLSLPVCVLQIKIGLSKGQHNARRLKGSRFLLAPLTPPQSHFFPKW